MNKSQYLSNFWIELTFLITTLSFLDFFNPFLPLFFFMFHLPIDALLPFYILWIPFLCPPLRFGIFWKSLSLYLVIIMTVHCPLKKISLSKLKKKLFIFGCAGSLLRHADLHWLRHAGFSLWRLVSLWSAGSRAHRLQVLQLAGSRAFALQ